MSYVVLLIPHSAAFCVHFVGLVGCDIQLKTDSKATISFLLLPEYNSQHFAAILWVNDVCYLVMCVCVHKMVLCGFWQTELRRTRLSKWTHKVWVKFEMAKKRSGQEVAVYVVYLWLFSGFCFFNVARISGSFISFRFIVNLIDIFGFLTVDWTKLLI